ncbi:MAG: superoxide dismutase [Bacteroidota bacterium]
MNKREFLKSSAIIGAGTLIVPSVASSCMNSSAANGATASLVATGDDGKFVQPELGYAFDALEPHIDAMTMELHYGKHHAGYTRKFNAALEHEDFHSTDLYNLFASVSQYGSNSGIRNNGGGYFNHNLYWKFMSPEGGGEPTGKLADAIAKTFGSFDQFKELFSATAASHFGSGWGWLILDGEGVLQVTSTPNQDNPLMDVVDVQGAPLLTIDVWEHAYYLNYQNMRKSYVDAFWNVIDWNFVGSLYEEAVSG